MTHADLMRIVEQGSRVSGYTERVRSWLDSDHLPLLLKREYGTGGHSFTFADGSRGFIGYRPAKGIIVVEYDGAARRETVIGWERLAELTREHFGLTLF